jgi:hypothetical protein
MWTISSHSDIIQLAGLVCNDNKKEPHDRPYRRDESTYFSAAAAICVRFLSNLHKDMLPHLRKILLKEN